MSGRTDVSAQNDHGDVVVARQAIYDRSLRVVGYELLFRSATGERIETIGGTTASARVLSDYLTVHDRQSLTGGLPAFINFTRELVTGDLLKQLSPTQLAIEILEEIEPDEEVLAACRQLVRRGFTVALDDVSSLERLVAFDDAITLVKVDFLVVDEDELLRIARYAKQQGLVLLAEKVVTWDDFSEAIDLGFDRFQGYFLSTPTLVRHRTVRAFKSVYMRLLTAVQREEVDFDELASIIKTDLGLTNLMLRFANSAHAAQRRKIGSLKDALVIQGNEGVRRTVMLLLLADVGGGSPEQLAIDSVSRARFCELMAEGEHEFEQPSFELFLLGMFSLLASILRVPVDQAIRDLPLPDAVRHALVEGEGDLATLLHLVEAYEHDDWEAVRRDASALGIDELAGARRIMEAWSWTGEAFQGVSAA